jgi:hypothetical protein
MANSKRKIKVVPMKSPRLCAKCMHSIKPFFSKDCADIKSGEPCKMFVKKKPHFKLSEHYMAFFDEDGCEIFHIDDGKGYIE